MDKYVDERGKLLFPIKNNNFIVKESTISINHKNVFRGIHVNQFDKLVVCISGKILDIVISFNIYDDDFLIPKYYILDPNTDLFQILVPKNHGHSFLSLEENSILLYYFNGEFNDEHTIHYHYTDPILKIILPITNPILSNKDNIKNYIKSFDYLVFGYKGFLGSNIVKYLKIKNKNYIVSNLRLNQINEIIQILNKYNPKYVINCAGITGNPNIFWCDVNKTDTIENNLTYQLTLAAICKQHNIHLTIFGSGGIFDSDNVYDENDKGNFKNNFYSECRINLENIVQHYEKVLYLRINYPIANDHSPKNLLTKLISYKNIQSNNFSITYVDDLFPILFEMIEDNVTGICNFTNPGITNSVEIINFYKNYHNTHYFNIIYEQDFKRSYSKLSPNKILKYNPLSVQNAIKKCIENYKII